jgi:hypothetical protein
MGEYRNGKYVATFGDEEFGGPTAGPTCRHETVSLDAKVAELEAENDRLKAKCSQYIALLDKQNGTPCEQIRHQQEVEALQAENDRLREELHLTNKLYGELLMQVGDKHPKRNRHESALWILKRNNEIHAAYDEAIKDE